MARVGSQRHEKQTNKLNFTAVNKESCISGIYRNVSLKTLFTFQVTPCGVCNGQSNITTGLFPGVEARGGAVG
jgi:hypothetical protein